MYNKPVRFDGDIIITDPCYIINHENDDPAPYPFIQNFVTLGDDPKLYPDCREKTILDCVDECDKRDLLLHKALGVPRMFSPMLNAERRVYYDALDAYYSTPHDDWDRCDDGENMAALGLKTFLCDGTIYGDWSCTTFNSDTKEKIGEFCADAGMVAVFLLDEVLKYNPNFDYHINRPWTTTLIRDFHGTVELHCEKDDEGDSEVTVVGNGNINFIGCQTGF